MPSIVPALVLAACLAGCHVLLPLEPPAAERGAGPGDGPLVSGDADGALLPELSVTDLASGEAPRGDMVIGPAQNGCAALPSGSPSGVYSVDPDGPGGASAFLAYCEMVADGGGWTLVLKADGSLPTFHYDGALWTNGALLNPDKPDLDQTEAKLAGFTTMPFTALRLGMIDGGVTRWIVVNVSGSSLHDVMSTVPAGTRANDASTIVKTSAGRATWFKLLASPSLQTECNQEGLNNDDGYGSRVRIGIVGNNEPNCGNTDSWIGFGGMEDWCSTKINATVGNGDCHWETNTKTDTPTFGYVMIR